MVAGLWRRQPERRLGLRQLQGAGRGLPAAGGRADQPVDREDRLGHLRRRRHPLGLLLRRHRHQRRARHLHRRHRRRGRALRRRSDRVWTEPTVELRKRRCHAHLHAPGRRSA